MPRPRIHGLINTSEYSAWVDMRQRCNNPNHQKYHRYGGRGIIVCERWNDFRNFFADMGPKPSSRYSLDRINNDGNYEPGNCRWATQRQQMYNKQYKNQNTNKTHCNQGHEFIGDNYFINSFGRRVCYICTNARQKRYRAAAKAKIV